MNGSITHSNYGHLLNRSTAELASSYRNYKRQVDEIDNCDRFCDAYAYECARNDRSDYVKRLRDLAAELNARMMLPEASLRVIRDHEITAIIREKYAAAR